jgi:hypothetical protein
MNIYFTMLLEGSSIARLFQEQITHIIVKTRNEVFTNELFTDACARVLAICTNLSYLNMNQWIKGTRSRLLLRDRPLNICSSHLRTLSINVETFDDCLCLLDGRLDQLSSFTVNIHSIKRSPMIDDNQVGILYIKYNLSAIKIVNIQY